jgi:uncharacterized protein YcfL
MKKIMFAAFVAGLFMCVSCKSDVDKVVELKKQQIEAVKDLDFKKMAELEDQIEVLEKNMTPEEKKEVRNRMKESKE